MSYEFVVRFDEALCRRAVARYWQGQFGWRTVIELIAGIAILIFIAPYTVGWVTGAFGAVLFIYALLGSYAYFSQRKRILDVFRRMENPEASWVLNDAFLATRSSLGYSELAWSNIAELWKFDDLWLIFVAKNAFSTLPLVGVSTDARIFLENKIVASGGRIRSF